MDATVLLLDEITAICQNIATIGQLLAATKTGMDANLESQAVANAGSMIVTECEKMRELIARLEEPSGKDDAEPATRLRAK